MEHEHSPEYDFGALTALIREHRPRLRSFSREEYPGCFEEYAGVCEPAFTALDSAFPTDDADTPVHCAAIAARVMDALATDWAGSAAKGLLRHRRETFARENDKALLAWYFSPAALKHGGSAEIFARALADEWGRRMPKGMYVVGSYESIVKGFKRRFFSFVMSEPDD